MTFEIGIAAMLIVILQALAARERRELYSRLQAGTLTDYTSNAMRAEEPKHTVVAAALGPDDDEPHSAYHEPQVADYVESQSAFNRLMG